MKTNFKNYNISKERQHITIKHLRSFLIIAVLTIASLNIHANNKNIIKSDTSKIDTFNFYEEIEMELEPWMLDSDLFQQFVMNRKTGFNKCSYYTRTNEEKELPLEIWMMDKELFHKRIISTMPENSAVAERDMLK